MANIDSKKNTSVIVLAAGLSKRMGSQNKLHLPINGQAILLHCINGFLDAGLKDIVVVLGHQHQLSAGLIDDLDVTVVVNLDYAKGQISSVRRGLGSVQASSNSTFIALGDQPAVSIETIDTLLEAFDNRGSAEAIVPYFEAKRGNPILISADARQNILNGKSNFGCRNFIDNNASLVLKIDVCDAGVVTDLDTPTDYQNYCKRISALESEAN